ncbi:unnamed protein product, partial [Didymodactylos carnosus]
DILDIDNLINSIDIDNLIGNSFQYAEGYLINNRENLSSSEGDNPLANGLLTSHNILEEKDNEDTSPPTKTGNSFQYAEGYLINNTGSLSSSEGDNPLANGLLTSHNILEEKDNEDTRISHPTKTDTQLQIINGVRKIYRPLMKSDIFPQSGKYINKPRAPHYIQDKYGAGYITLKAKMYRPRNTKIFFVQVTLLTVPLNGQFYISPNKLQIDHKHDDIEDRNPIYYIVGEDGEIKLKLVVIRTKKCDLRTKNVQPLKQFQRQLNMETALNPTRKKYYHGNERLIRAGPKDAPLINDIDENDIEILYESTVISDVMEEDKRRQRKVTRKSQDVIEILHPLANEPQKRKDIGLPITYVKKQRQEEISN